MDLRALKGGVLLGEMRVMSVGGGRIQILGEAVQIPKIHYTLKSFDDIRAYCEEKNIRLSMYKKMVNHSARND